MKKQTVYEEAAVHTAVEGWACKGCGLFCGNGVGAERAARWCCCKDRPCDTDGCEGRAERSWARCPSCRALRESERWEAREVVPYDGETPLYSVTLSKYFFDLSDVCDEAVCEKLTWDEMWLAPCVPVTPPSFNVEEFLGDEFANEDGEVYFTGEPVAIEKIVNDWVAKNVAKRWWEDTHKRIDITTLPVLVEKDA